MAVDNIADALEEAIDIKSDIRDAIIERGVAVPQNTKFEDYPGKIALIKGIRQIKTLTPTAAGGTVSPDTGYDGFEYVILPAEPNLIPANISDGVSIFGVTGTAQTATFDVAGFFARTLTSLTLGVATIGNYAFYEFATLQSFTDTSLATLGQYAFYNCTALASFAASASLTELKAYAFYGCSALATMDLSHIVILGNYALYNCTRIANIGTLKIPKIGQYGAYYLGANASSGFKYAPETAAEVENYGLQYAKITEISGTIKKIGEYAMSYLNSLTKIDAEIDGPIENYGLYNNQYVKTVDFSDSNITKLGQYALYQFGWNRSNYSSDPYMELDFRNSSFDKVDQYSLSYIRYANIYLPSSVKQMESYAFSYDDHINLFMSGPAPTLSSSYVFNGASNYKVYAPWTYLAGYMNGTNWSSISSNIIGYAPAGAFTAGATLPQYNAEGYEVTWYSDAARTTQITTCPTGSPMIYCSVGSTKVKQVVIIANSGPITLAVTDSSSNPVDISNGFFLCDNGDTFNINASTSETGYTYYIKVNGVKVTSFPYVLTMGSSDVTINGTAYDPTAVNPDFFAATWRELKTAVETGVATTLYASNVGDTKEVTLKNGETVHLRLSNNTNDLYNLASGSGTTGFAFEFVECVATQYQMNTTNTNVGGWNASYMRNTVMPTILALLPDEIQEVIATVKRKSCYSGNDGTLVETEDDVFLLFDPEVFGNNGNARSEEKAANTRWQYYASHDTAPARIKQRSGSNNNWWLGSPCDGYTNNFCAVSGNGNASDYGASNNRGVAPGFCL